MSSGKKRATPLTFDYIRRPLEDLLQCLESGDLPAEARRATNLAFWVKLRSILGAGQLSSGLKYLDDVALALLSDNEEGAAELFSGVVTLVPPPEHQRGENRPADDAAFQELQRPASGDQEATVVRPSKKPKSVAAAATRSTVEEEPKVAPEKPQEEKPAAEKKAEKVDAAQPIARKRRTPSPRAAKKPKEKREGEDTEVDLEKQPKQKRAKTTKGVKRGAKPDHEKKTVVEPEEVEMQRQVEQKVAALSADIKGRFGQIVWAKMGGYPYWPCIIMDPRLLPRKLQEQAMLVLETKFLIFFYLSNNFAPISFKWVESWDDTKFNYREGYPGKDSKAPKRRVKLMQAIELADEETKLPIEKRADGMLNPDKE